MSKNKVINKRLLRAAYHQAGHTVAYLLTNRPFEFVTITPDSDTLGYIDAPYNDWSVDLKSKSFFKPSCLMIFFENSFISIAGYVTEKIYTGNSIGSRSFLKGLVNVSISDLSNKLNISYQKFLIQYTKEVLEKHWEEISVIAEELYKRRILTYYQVQKVIKERLNKDSKFFK